MVDQETDAKKLIMALREVIDLLFRSNHSDWTELTPMEIISHLVDDIASLEDTGRPADAERVQLYFLPTACIQEIAMENGWSDSYMRLAAIVDDSTWRLSRQSDK